MMKSSQEPSLLGNQSQAVPMGINEATLRQIMRDPRYWRDHDPELIHKVTTGYRQLYPDH